MSAFAARCATGFGARLGLVAALLALLLLSGCSAIRIVYNQADVLLAWRADDYFDLTDQQKEALRGHIDRFHAWHRSEQLPDYVALLEAARKRYADGVSRADVDWAIDAVKQRYGTIVRQAHGDAAGVLATLAPPQLLAAQRRFDKVNAEYAERYALGEPEAEQHSRRVKRMVERIEHWTGSLSREQRARIATLARDLPSISRLRHDDRLRRQREFLALLEGRGNSAAFPARLRDWLLAWDRGRAPEYERELARFNDKSAELYVAIDRMLSSEQRANVLARIDRYIAEFRQLSARPVTSAELR